MREQLLLLLAHVRGAWRFKWTALVVAWAVAIIGWIVVSSIPSHYEARAKIFVDAESVLKPLLQGLAVNTDVMNQANMMSRVMMSRPNLEKVAQETDLALRAPTPEAFQKMVESLPQRIGLNGAGNIFSVSFQDRDPQMAYRVVKTLVDNFVETAIGVKREDASGAQRFLKEQLSEYEQKLRDAEDRLAQFKKENIGLMPGQTGDYYQRSQAASEELAKLKQELEIAEQRRDEVKRQLQGEEPTLGLFTTGTTTKATTPVEAKIAELQREKEKLLLEYTDKHPRIRSIDETIAQLRQQKDPNAVAPPAPDTDPSHVAARRLDVSPVYQDMKINLSHAELDVVELRNKIAQQQAQVNELRGRANTIPEVEAQLSRLNRDYEVNRAQYQALLQRLESARLSEEAEGAREQVKFRVIEPPAVPLAPFSPNRQLLITAVLALALGAGVAAAVLRNLLNPVFSDRHTFTATAQVPLLGVVTLARSMSTATASKSLQWVGAFAVLVLLYVTVLGTATRLAILLGAMAR